MKPRKFKPVASPHQKQMRFFTGLFMAVIVFMTILLMWLLGREP